MTSVTPVEDLLIRQILFVVTSEVYKVTSQEQVRKGVTPTVSRPGPFNRTAGVNHPSLLVLALLRVLWGWLRSIG